MDNVIRCGVNPKSLADLLALASAQHDPWSDAELAAILQAWLAEALPLGYVRQRAAGKEGDPSQPPLRRMRDLFCHPTPPVTLLRQIKDHAKADRRHPTPAHPEKINFAIYYACIAAALLRGQARISTLSQRQLERAFAKLAKAPWMDADLKHLFTEAGKALPNRAAN